MRVHCPRCGGRTPAANVDLRSARAHCPGCFHRFHLLDGMERPPPKGLTPPPNLYVEKLGNELVIVRRWYTSPIWVAVVFCVIWNGVVFGVLAALMTGSVADERILWIVVGVFGAAGLLVAYGTLCQVVNRTTVRVGEREISVSHGPLPMFRSHRIDLDGVERLCTTQVAAWANDSREAAAFAVHAFLHGGGRATLVSQLMKPEEAWFIESQINKYLGVEAAMG